MSTELRRDTRGAILVIAVFMAVFLVGSLWYLVVVGDAAIYREKMQDGADATAFASAVYHARGMNIIAMLNLIMAAALAVLIAFKVAEVLAFTIAAIAGAICALTGASCVIAADAFDIGMNLQNNIIPKVQKVVDTVLKACSESQRWVARLTPWVGAARGAVAATNYGPTVKGGVAISLSMIPMGDRLGLPVQEEPFEKLCERAGTMLGNLAFGWIPGMSLAGGLVGKLAKTFPGFFCGGSGGGGGVSAQDQTQAIKDQCKQAEQAYNQANQNNKNAKPFDMKKCEKDAAENMKKNPQSAPPNLGSTGGKTSKMIYSPAQNGDDYFQVYGFVIGDNDAMHQNAQKRVEMPAWGKYQIQPNALTDTLEKTGFAEAEFYYDQTKKGKLAWGDYKDEALWNMRWRARLRRFRLPTALAMDSLNGAIGNVPGVPQNLKQQGQGWVTSVAQQVDKAVDTVVIH